MILFRDMIGIAIRHERLRQKHTLRGTAFRANLSYGFLSELERGIKEPSSETLNSLCKALDTPLHELLRLVANDLEMLSADVELTKV